MCSTHRDNALQNGRLPYRRHSPMSIVFVLHSGVNHNCFRLMGIPVARATYAGTF
jgi:hypothetical protein